MTQRFSRLARLARLSPLARLSHRPRLAGAARRIARLLLALPVVFPAWAGPTPAPAMPDPAAAARPACPPTTFAEAEPGVDRGPLWTVERDGRRSWLYGTIHVGRPGWQVPGPTVAAALDAADVVALELDPEDPAVLRTLLAAAAPPFPALPAPLADRLGQALRGACLEPLAAAPLHPAMRALALSLAEARRGGVDAAFAQEPALSRAARAAGKPLLSLETAALQAALLLPRDAGAAADAVERSLQPVEAGRAGAVAARLADAWARGDLETLGDLERWCDCVADDADRAALRALNDERNPALADAIAALHAGGRRVFAAVGALHMTGPQALPALLAARGFDVRRVVPPHSPGTEGNAQSPGTIEEAR